MIPGPSRTVVREKRSAVGSRTDQLVVLEIHNEEVLGLAQLFEDVLLDAEQGLFSHRNVGIEAKLF